MHFQKLISNELYMSIDQIKCIKRNGMFIGSHGYNHYWLSDLNEEKQEKEIELSLKFLQIIGCDTDNWIICYPYGDYNDSLLAILRNKGCKIGLSNRRIGIANIDNNNNLTLPRLDTNDLLDEAMPYRTNVC